LKNKKVHIQNLGLIDYQEAHDLQVKFFQETIDLKLRNRVENTEIETQNHILICQHPHVYTLGRSGAKENLLIDAELLAKKNATYYEIGRGGDITYHGPGQLVVYPILDLDNFFTDIHKYLRFLEEAVILTLAEYGIKAGRIDGLTGVWLDHEKQIHPRKICALGVKASRWVTMHGLALNVETDLSYFGNIIPCGISDKAVSSLHLELLRKVDLDEVSSKIIKHISHLFEMEIE